MKFDIRAMINGCEPCQHLQPSKAVEPFITTTASFPMEQITIYLFHVAGKTYMVTADRFSGYLWVDLLRSQGTKAVTDVVDKITRIFGVPLWCRTDGGPQFWGPFEEYCKNKGIVHETSSPYNPQSNGHAEAAVKIAKHLMPKHLHLIFQQHWRLGEIQQGKTNLAQMSLCFTEKSGTGNQSWAHIWKSGFLSNKISRFSRRKMIKFMKAIRPNVQQSSSERHSVSKFLSSLIEETAYAFKTRKQNAGISRRL